MPNRGRGVSICLEQNNEVWAADPTQKELQALWLTLPVTLHPWREFTNCCPVGKEAWEKWLLVLDFPTSGWFLLWLESLQVVWFRCSSYCTSKEQPRWWRWRSSQSPLTLLIACCSMRKSLLRSWLPVSQRRLFISQSRVLREWRPANDNTRNRNPGTN